MKKNVSIWLIAAAMFGLAACGEQAPPAPPAADAAKAQAAAEAEAKAKAAAEAAAAKEKEALAAAIDAYIYAYPLVTMEFTRRVSTNVAAPEGSKAPMGQIAKLRQYPDASFKTVTAPNADTLYTVVWLDVSKEPWIVSIPDLKGRYALFPMLSGWTDVFQVPGKRTTGTGAQKYAITGPGWTGTLPAGVTEYKSPTGMVWLLGRIYCTGTPEDYKAVHALQDQMSAVPLSRLRQAVQAGAGRGRRERRHEDRRARAGQRDGRRVVLQAVRRAAEDEPAGGRGCADGGEAGEASESCRGRTSMRRSSIRPWRRVSPARPSPRRKRSWAG